MESSLRGHYQQQQQAQQQHHQSYPPTANSRSALSNSLSGHAAHQQYHPHHHHHHSNNNQASDYASVGSYYSRGSHASSQQSSQVDEAARRLGHRLSMRAHGDKPVSRPQRLSRIGLTPKSGFMRYTDRPNQGDDTVDMDVNSQSTPASSVNRTTKVAKTRYSDHGDHHRHKPQHPKVGNIVRKMTINAADFFRLWQKEAASAADGQQHQQQHTIQSPKQQQRQSHHLQQQQSTQQQQSHKQQQSHQNQRHHNDDHHSLFSKQDKEPGGLTAVIENSSLTSSTTRKTSLDNDSLRSMKSLPSANSSIATKESLDKSPQPPQGRCLTQPSAPASNNELDNAEGNLIVCENDVISLTRKQIHVLTKEKMKNAKRADFQIVGMLGQGTFAQVFQALHVQTGQMVAVKVVKNKPAYTRQAAVEIDVFRALVKKPEKNVSSSQSHKGSPSSMLDETNMGSSGSTKWEHMVDLICYFMYKSHLCLVFEILGLNLYEVLKRRQFRGLPLNIVRTLLKQAVGGVKELAKKSIVHCDIKPENILLAKEDETDSVVSAGEHLRRFKDDIGTPGSKGSLTDSGRRSNLDTPPTSAIQGNLNQTLKTLKAPQDKLSASPGNSLGTAGTFALTSSPGIKLIDFGSACFEGQTAHTYIQSRFYRSPEVLIGLPYDSAIDMWSLGCVAAELFLGLPILPGVHEHDQLSRVSEMVAKVPEWMLEQGSKSSKYYVKYMPRSNSTEPPSAPSEPQQSRKPKWRLQTQAEYIAMLTTNEIRKKGGLAKLEKQPTNRYFKKKKLGDIIMHKGLHGKPEDMESLELFIHFLYGILDPDPWKRWTAHQASQHPFITGGTVHRKSQGAPFGEAAKEQNQANKVGDVYWDPPWDPGICRRKLLNVQKMREKQNSARRGGSSYRNHGAVVQNRPSSASSEGSGDRNYSTKATHGSDTSTIPSQQGLGAVLASQGMVSPRSQYQMSTSLSDHPNAHSGRIINDSSSIAGDMSHPGLYQNGGQSYTDASYAGTWQGSITEAEFAYALQRPGVVPMGGSVASVDLSVGQNSHQLQQAVAGSYGGNGQRQNGNGLSSRSFGGNGDPGLDGRRYSLGAAPGSLGQHLGGSVGQQVPSSLGQQLPGSVSQQVQGSLGQQQFVPGSLGQPPAAAYGQQAMYAAQPSSIPQSIEAGSNMSMSQIGNLSQDSLLASDPAFAQAYLQQQHAALQQQQALLQQQQAALALQQEQLRSYGVNPGLLNLNPATGLAQAGGMNQFVTPQQGMLGQQMVGQQQMVAAQQPQQQLAATNNGYYYVTAADGTPMLVTNQGMQQQQQVQPGMPSSYGMPQNYQNHDGSGGYY